MAMVFWHNLTTEETIGFLKSDFKKGISEKEAEIRQRKFGKNLLPKEKPLPAVRIFLAQFSSPLIYILLTAGIITALLEDFSDAAIIFIAVFLNSLVGFLQENKATKALKALKEIVERKAAVFREGNFKTINSAELVPGDLIFLNAGDKVPADARIIESLDLEVNEMILTGEWLASQKKSQVLPVETPPADRDNMLYMGTIIEKGKGKAVVTATGGESEIGKIAKVIKETPESKTPYQKKLAHFSKITGIFIGLISLAIFLGGIMAGGKFIEMFTTAVAVAVAAIPEGLPVALTVILTLGMQRILKKQGLVRKLASAETLGSTSVIAVDKTATLTEGKMRIAEVIGDEIALRSAFAVSQAFIENPGDPEENWLVRGEATDKAFLLAGLKAGFKKNELGEKEAELLFGHQNRFGAVLYREKERSVLYVAGAPEKIFELCRLAGREKKDLEEKLAELAKKGWRVVATASKVLESPESKIEKLEDFCRDLFFAGFITLEDPLRKDAREAIEICRQAGMKTIIVTGDHKLTAQAVAEKLGMEVGESDILEGKDLESDKNLEKNLDKIKIYARVEPRHKLKIIEAWQKRGEVVAMTGDGVNDAPALKKADIGIALGSGAEAAKETADLVLLDDSFSIIVKAIEEGRAILDNIRKVITYLLSDSFTEVILIGGSAFIGWLTNQPLILPVLAGQILWVNLIEDGPLGLALAFEPKEKDLMRQKPQRHNAPLLTGEMKTLIFIIGLITDFLLLGLFFWLTKYSGYETSHIRSIMFAGLAIDSIFFIFSCKSLKKNLWQTNPFDNRFLIFAWLFGLAMLLAALYLPVLQALLKTVSLNIFDWQVILGLGALNIFLIEATKFIFIKKMIRFT